MLAYKCAPANKEAITVDSIDGFMAVGWLSILTWSDKKLGGRTIEDQETVGIASPAGIQSTSTREQNRHEYVLNGVVEYDVNSGRTCSVHVDTNKTS